MWTTNTHKRHAVVELSCCMCVCTRKRLGGGAHVCLCVLSKAAIIRDCVRICMCLPQCAPVLVENVDYRPDLAAADEDVVKKTCVL